MRRASRGSGMTNVESPPPGRFERVVLPHLSAGYTLAMYLTRNPADAEDAVQEAILRAVRYFSTLRDADARAWFLTIVRRVCFTAYRTERPQGADMISIDVIGPQLVDSHEQPDIAAERLQVQQRVRAAV